MFTESSLLLQCVQWCFVEIQTKYRQITCVNTENIQKNNGENRQNTEKTVVYYAEMQCKRGHIKQSGGTVCTSPGSSLIFFLDYISPQVQFQPVFAAHK